MFCGELATDISNQKKPRMKRSIKNLFLLPALIAGLGLMLAGRVTAQTNHTAIPFSQIGAAASEHYIGNGLSIVQNAEGACLRCVFQKLEGRVSCQGLWLTSTDGPSNSAPFRVVAQSVGREHCLPLPLAGTGAVEVLSGSARFHRTGLDEEYTVSVDGVRQEGSGRVLAFSRLRAVDAAGWELTARFEVLSTNRLGVLVADANATYPVRIDPTFSDANWVSLNPGMPGADGKCASINNIYNFCG
jgi:hypothetical protein